MVHRLYILTLFLTLFISPLYGERAQPSNKAPLRSFVYPLIGERISSKFGVRSHPVLRYKRHHNGLDLAAPEGAIIRSVAGGRVVFADPYKGYGNLVVVEHGVFPSKVTHSKSITLTSHYGHCRKLRVQPGMQVSAGQILATVGSTGLVSGPHLHFEVREDGDAVDPLKYLPGLNQEAKG